MTREHRVCRSFADGFPNLFVKDATRIRNRHVAFLASFHNPGTIFEQISVIYQLPRMFCGSFTLVLPYFPTGTAERVRGSPLALQCPPACQPSCMPCSRMMHCLCMCPQVEAEGDVATAFTLARILSNIPLSRGGPTSVVIFDIHALQVCFGGAQCGGFVQSLRNM